ncbi:MAG: hypothetical protein NZ700_10635 [Gemmataceae bacterium]|nr:hypothetical protein [Gemmataceae bacterium]MDW8264445.1 hypothetical protein [Gemmataceae bacterium]
MLRAILAIPMLAPLLLPPGYCICHIFDQEPDSSAPFDHHDHPDKHVPGCPARKAAMLPAEPPVYDVDETGPVCLAAPEQGDPSGSADELAHVCLIPFYDPTSASLYLTLRALRI